MSKSGGTRHQISLKVKQASHVKPTEKTIVGRDISTFDCIKDLEKEYRGQLVALVTKDRSGRKNGLQMKKETLRQHTKLSSYWKNLRLIELPLLVMSYVKTG